MILCLVRLLVFGVISGVWVFFFKQKTAYEMRISDWSSDVCSSDLSLQAALAEIEDGGVATDDRGVAAVAKAERGKRCAAGEFAREGLPKIAEIGRASCRKECVSTGRSRWSPYQ